MRKTTTLRRLAVAVIVVLVAACGGENSDQAPEQTLVFAIEGDPTVLDGARGSGGPSARVGSQIFEGLLTVGPSGELRPSLARSWHRSADGRSWTFELQEDVKFHDGT